MYSGDRSKPVIVFDQTTVVNLPHMDLAETIHNVSERIPGGIASEIFNDFLKKNQRPLQLEQRLNVEVAYVLVGREDLDRIFQKGDGWSQYYASYGGRGIINVSSVGFDREMNQALVYTCIQSGPKSGAGYYILLAAENGTWVIKHKAEVWVS